MRDSQQGWSTGARAARVLGLVTTVTTIATVVTGATTALGARPAGAQGAARDDSLLVSPAWVAAQLDSGAARIRRGRAPDVVVVQVGSDRGVWRAGHVPGAAFLLAGEVSESRDSVPSELPPRPVIARTFALAGVHDGARVVLYGEAMPVARAALALAAIGHERVSLLDGGLARWKAEGHPLATNEERAVRRPLTVRPPRDSLLVDAQWVRARSAGGSATVLDVRTADEFAGAGPRRMDSDGHVPGARHLDWTALLAPGGRDDLVFRPRAELDSLFRARGVAPAGSGATVAAYCTVGQRAAVGWLAARLLGHDARVYDGSYVDWVRRGLPLERGGADSTRTDSTRADSARTRPPR